jgi:catechol 2,3-dioxygenase-like lactoylglutathione lyase family enzyme
MKLKVNGIDHLNMEVISLNKTVEFYSQLFGFTVLKEQPEENSKIIGNENVKLCLYETGDFHGYTKKGFHHFGLHIENFEDVMNKCTEMGIEIFYGGPLKWEKSTSIYIKDPNGYEIELTKVFGGGL